MFSDIVLKESKKSEWKKEIAPSYVWRRHSCFIVAFIWFYRRLNWPRESLSDWAIERNIAHTEIVKPSCSMFCLLVWQKVIKIQKLSSSHMIVLSSHFSSEQLIFLRVWRKSHFISSLCLVLILVISFFLDKEKQ